MNERIKLLATQATRQYSPTYYRQEWIQCLAQLIVQECAEICLEANDHKNILRHFGIEPDVNENLRNRSTYFGNDI